MHKIALLLSLAVLAAAPLAYDAFGHGFGSDTAPAISFSGMNVTVNTQLSPPDLTVGAVDDANMRIQFFDDDTGDVFEEVAYRVTIFRSNEMLVRELFYDRDGTLDVEIRPIDTCLAPKLIECTKVFGDIHPIAGGYFAYGENRPLVKGPIFDKGGMYHIRVTIEGASTPKTLISQIDQDQLTFDTFVSVAQEQDFVIQTAHADELPIQIKTYYDDILNLAYSPADHSLKFDMPFVWDPDYVSLVQYVHEEVRLPNAPPYNDVTDFTGYINGIEVDSDVIRMEPFNQNNNTIVHFVVFGNELQRINDILGESNYNSNTMTFQLVPSHNDIKNTIDFYFVNPTTFEPTGATATISWDAEYGVNEEIPVVITFFDETDSVLKDIMYAYTVYDESNNRLASGGDDIDDLGIYAFEGIDIQKITFPPGQQYRIDVAILGQGSGFDPRYAGIGSAIVKLEPSTDNPTSVPGVPADTNTIDTKPAPDTVPIPSWIKNNAALWSNDVIDDLTFASGIQHLVENGIITVSDVPPAVTNQDGIPAWIKNIAMLWSEDQIGDQEFTAAIEFLLSTGIISVG